MKNLAYIVKQSIYFALEEKNHSISSNGNTLVQFAFKNFVNAGRWWSRMAY
tara:strand:- start:389 stop:541 length:153 start_codon:yes stop_codon:yes gene_type:complete